jgi:hypothetical protein
MMDWSAPWLYRVKRLVINGKAGEWCKLPYEGHKEGCPNYGDLKHSHCPPHAPPVGQCFDLGQPLYLVHSEFNLPEWEMVMKYRHPSWSERQCRCVLYWQNQSRKQLKERTRFAMVRLGLNQAASCPEGMGVNVYVSSRLAGLRLEKIRRLETCQHVALIGTRP